MKMAAILCQVELIFFFFKLEDDEIILWDELEIIWFLFVQVHATLHTGEKPNVCPICGKAFRVRANYFKHRKIHMRASNAVVQVSDQADCLLNEPDHMGQTDQEQMVVVPAASGTADFFHFGGDQQWITWFSFLSLPYHRVCEDANFKKETIMKLE